jgi:hypothetical protein
MRALAFVCLGISILIPEASAQSKAAAPANAAQILTGSTDSNLKPATSSQLFTVLAETGDQTKRSFAVQLERRVTESELKRIAGDIRVASQHASAAAVVMFYLPGMKIGHGVWAHTYFPAAHEPTEPKATIVGLTIAEEERLIQQARRDSRNLIGAWLTAAPAPVGKLTLYREKNRLFAEWGLRDGARFSEEVVETALPEGGWRYDRRDGGAGDHMRMMGDGELELRDRNDVATSTQAIRRQPGDFKTAVARTNEMKAAESKGLTDKADSKKPVGTAKVAGAVTMIGSATTTAGSLSAAGSADKQPKAKIAQPIDQPVESNTLANVMFR